jgi:L-lactate dehydrogenase complex protein LldF
MSDARRFAAAEAAMRPGRLLAREGRIRALPPPLSLLGAGWTSARDLPGPPPETFRQWWSRTRGSRGTGAGTRATGTAASAANDPEARR